MTKVIWSLPAVSDLERIHDYICTDSVAYADALVSGILSAVNRLGSFLRSGRIVPEIRQNNTRELIVGHYRVIYDIRGHLVRILTVIHGARLIQK